MRVFALLFLAFLASGASAIDISNRYRSPRNAERRVRKSTELIVLHTTEAPARSSLNKLCERGEAHYCVTEVGTVYRIIDRDRVAFHAGRSMWNGKEDVDEFSVERGCLLPLEMNACLPGCVWNATPRSLSPLERNTGFWTPA